MTFKPSRFNKYRNATAAVPGRELWYSELSIDTSVAVGANGLAIDGAALYARTSSGNALQAIDLAQPGNVGAHANILSALPGRILDFNTATHDDCLVVASDELGNVGLWRNQSLVYKFSAYSSACVSACFHPTVASVVVTAANATSNSGKVCLWNTSAGNVKTAAFWSAAIQGGVDSVSLQGDGRLVAASTRAGVCLLYDPRKSGSSDGRPVGSTSAFHASGRPTRALWAGELPFLLTTGQTKTRERSAAMWDQRNMSQPLSSIQLQPSTKPLIPLYDDDTRLAYLVETGDNAIRWVDGDPSSAAPLSELGSVLLPSPVRGCGLLPKRQLHVMRGEISRIHALVDSTITGQGAAIIPISNVVPRRTYLDFHADLFPDTKAPFPAQSFAQWMAQEPVHIPKMSLDPSKTAESLAALRRAYALNTEACELDAAQAPPEVGSVAHLEAVPVADNTEFMCGQSPGTQTSSIKENITPEISKSQIPAAVVGVIDMPHVPYSRYWKLPQIGYARFKYLEGYTYPPSESFTNISNTNLRFSQQSSPVKVGSKFVAISCNGAGGQVSVLCRDSPGRVPDKHATLVHGADVVDIGFDLFDPNIVATAGIDGRLQMWRIPNTQLEGDTLFELEEYIHISADRIHQIRFHPCAKGVIAVLVSEVDEYSIYIYSGLLLQFIVGKSQDGIHSFEWSPDGSRIALTTKKSKQLRVYDVRSQELLAKGPGMDSIRPSRIAWLGSSRICLAGFGSGSQRQLCVYDAEMLSKPLASVTIDIGPGVLVPFTDVDCRIIYLDDRGSRLTHAFELVDDSLVVLPKYESAHPSLGMDVLPKHYADISRCELMQAYRLSSQSLGLVGFRVPRKRPAYFQDDIFPNTVDVESPSVDTLAWLDGAAPTPRLINLCPSDMVPLSEAPPEAARKHTFAAASEKQYDNTKKAINAMLSRADVVSDEEYCGQAADSGSDWSD
ncbi:DUF1900-domain-containing protein [Coemansia reversa NRRL 1564]|uniref:DUF1900-domain-containing protein n=1 Tax=Coemansia reversa (strain ATCC 12441 / NRRL 1564) TaxID=763665 RepID=A0A2G5B192_COERN|nr:DUF1900-domain-containing protein [Coemansia reversa NRRL 1564]|eukprot:PIA12788.1 DUF1900-domain-containing protein [Coemansia reversa NRRL 1564]